MTDLALWSPDLVEVEDDPTLVWVSAPFAMPRSSKALLGRTLLIGRVPHRVVDMLSDEHAHSALIQKGQRITLRVCRVQDDG